MKELLCITCPNGCHLLVDDDGSIAGGAGSIDGGGEIRVSGNQCKRGIDFAKMELINPMRSLTTTVRTVFAEVPVLPVRTAGEIPKGKIRELMGALNTVTVAERLGIGEVVTENVLGLGVNVIATSNILKEVSL